MSFSQKSWMQPAPQATLPRPSPMPPSLPLPGVEGTGDGGLEASRGSVWPTWCRLGFRAMGSELSESVLILGPSAGQTGRDRQTRGRMGVRMQCCTSGVGLDLRGAPDWPAPGPVPDAWGSGGADAQSLRQPGESQLFAATAMGRFLVAAGLGRPDASLKVLTSFQFPLLSGKSAFPECLFGFVEWYVRMRCRLSRCHQALCSVALTRAVTVLWRPRGAGPGTLRPRRLRARAAGLPGSSQNP